MDILNNAITQGVVPAIVVAVYLLITKLLDNKKENNQIKITSDLSKSINTISNFVLNLTKDIIDKDKEKCKVAIEDAMFSAGMRLCNFVTSTIINNHIDVNKENVLANIHNIVNAEYYNVYSTLSLYTIDSKKISDYLHKEWIEDIEKDMIDIIYNDKLSKEDKILSFSNKVNIKFQSYITNVINHSLK